MVRTNSDVRTNNNVTYRCHYHVVWCPKYRRKVITSLDPSLSNPPIEGDPGPIDTRLLEILDEVATEHGAEIIEVEAMPDHVTYSSPLTLSSASTNSSGS